MPRIVTGQISYASAVRDTTDETYTHGSRAYFGSEGGASGIDNIYVLYFAPVAGDLQDVASNEIRALRIRLTLKKKTTVATDSEFIYKLYSSEQSWNSPKSLYDVVDGGEAYTYAWVDFANTLEAQEIVISLTGTAAYYAAQYGFSMANLTLGDIVEVTSYTMEADVSDRYVPPSVYLTNGFGQVVEGKYWHNPENRFTLIVDYVQEVEEPIETVQVIITTKGGTQRTFYSEYGLNSVDVPDYVWSNLPQYGSFKIDVTSTAGVAAETIEMPFEVAQYNIRYTSHTSGTIIESNADITVSWQADRPDILPSGVDVGAPTRYVCYVWFDDSERAGGVGTQETTYTIPAALLEGHKSIHVAVTETYGDIRSWRDADYAPILNLYIQQVAGIGTVTVGDQWFSGYWYPGVTVSWESTNQTAFQVRVGEVHDSGPVWGTETNYKVPLLLDDGVYPVTVRIQDMNGVWNAWTSPVLINVENTYGGSYYNTLDVNKKTEYIEVSLKLDEREPADYSSILFYRNGIMVAQMEPSDIVEYRDRTAIGECTYSVRCVFSGSPAYDGPKPVTIDTTPDTDGMVLPDGSWLPLRYTETFPRRYPSSAGEEVYEKYYAGREYPVYMTSGRKNGVKTMTYTDKGNELADIMEELVGKCVLYKTTTGHRTYGILESVQAERGRKRCSVTFSLRQADFDDAVPYRWPEE